MPVDRLSTSTGSANVRLAWSSARSWRSPQELMRFWQTLIPDEPFIWTMRMKTPVVCNQMPPAVKARSGFLSQQLRYGERAPCFRNAAPLLVGAIFALFPLTCCCSGEHRFRCPYGESDRPAERYSSSVRPNLNQWRAIALRVARARSLLVFAFCRGSVDEPTGACTLTATALRAAGTGLPDVPIEKFCDKMARRANHFRLSEMMSSPSNQK